MDRFLNALASGVISGSLYAIMALGLSIIYGVSRVFNFAHGVVALIGGYLTWMFLTRLGLGLFPSMVLALLILFLAGWLLYHATIRGLLRKPNWEFSTVLFLLGLGILLENVLLQVFGPRVKAIPPFVPFDPTTGLGTLRVGPVITTWHDVLLVLVVVAAVLGLNAFLKWSWTGQAMRAVAASIPGALAVGIDIQRVFALTFALAFLTTGFSGVLLGTKYYMTPHVGWEWMVKGFVIVTFGGLGSTTGAIYAAAILGIVEGLVSLYLAPIWVWPIWFGIFLIVLLLRPQGIAGGRL
jgi:branched-chain amino acid transport system permease protein